MDDQPDQEEVADLLAAVLSAVMMPIAESRDRMPSTAVTPDEVDTISALTRLARALPDFCRRAVLGEIAADHWATLSDILDSAARTCRRHVVIDMRDPGAGDVRVRLPRFR